MWFTGSGDNVTFEAIIEKISSHMRSNGKVFIGCDSQVRKDKCTFSTVVCLHGADFQSGGCYFFKRENMSGLKYPTMINRLLKEVELSVETGFKILELKPNADIEIHIDANTKKEEATGRFSDMLMGYAKGAGFKCKVKPDAWASSSIADKHSK